MLPLIGAASVDRRMSLGKILGAFGVTAAFHAFAYIHNDVIDLEIDRSQPLRADYPLVRGDLSSTQALSIAWGCVPLAFALNEMMQRELPLRRRAGRGYLAAAFVLMAAYNLWGKRIRLPLLTDLIQGIGWSMLIHYGAALQRQPANRLTWQLSLYELFLILMVNGIHGSLRDLANDQEQGARTTALLLGADIDTQGKLLIARPLLAYTVALQLILFALPFCSLYSCRSFYSDVEYRSAMRMLTLLSICLAGLAYASQTGRLRAVDMGILHLLLILSPPVALLATRVDPSLRIALLGAHSISPLANGMTFEALRRLFLFHD